MTATTFQELRDSFNDPSVAAAFASAFAEGYFAVAFGSVPKSEVDQLVFDALVKVGVLDTDGAIYTIARVLKVTPAKARSLLFQHQLRNADDAALDAKVLATLASAKFSVDDKRLSFGVESPIVRTVIEARLKAAGIYSDISLSGEILKVPINQMGEFVRVFLTDDQAKDLQKRLKSATGEKGLIGALNGFAKSVASDLGKEATKEAGKSLLKSFFELAASGRLGDMANAIQQFMT